MQTKTPGGIDGTPACVAARRQGACVAAIVTVCAGLVALTAGCATPSAPMDTAPDSPPATTVIGRPIAGIVAGYEGHRMEFFGPDGESLDSLPEPGTAGSVSIHNADGTAQDNYSFDAQGKVNKHMRSAGANYTEGKWEVVE